MFKYSYNSLVYYGEDVDTSISRVAKFGYDALELYGEPREYVPAHVRKLCSNHGITISSICSIYTAERDLASPDEKIRQGGIDYMKRVADLAAEVECPVMIAAPTECTKLTPWHNPDEERKWAIESMRKGGEHAQTIGVSLTIEAWNRYETYFLNRIDQCLEFMTEVNLPNTGVMGDTFHMNIDEASIPDAFRLAGKNLNHVHLADSNRAAPGRGHLDFVPIIQVLKDIGYSGHLTFELLPAAADPFGTLKKGGGREFFDEYTEQSIKYMKEIEKKLT